jgi:hypothetical protein
MTNTITKNIGKFRQDVNMRLFEYTDKWHFVGRYVGVIPDIRVVWIIKECFGTLPPCLP